MAQSTVAAATFIGVIHLLTLLGLLWRLREHTGSLAPWIIAGAFDVVAICVIARLGWMASKQPSPRLAGIVLAWSILELLWKLVLVGQGVQPSGAIVGLHGGAIFLAIQGFNGARRLRDSPAVQANIFD